MERYKYYYYVITNASEVVVKGINEYMAITNQNVLNEYSIMSTFNVGKTVAYLKFIHQPLTFNAENEPYVFAVEQYDLAVSNSPMFEYRYVDFDRASEGFSKVKLRLSKRKLHQEPIRTIIPDLTPFINTSVVIDIPIEFATKNGNSLLKYLKIIEAAKDGRGGFLYPLYVKLNHPIEQFWVRLIKHSDKYYGIVENEIYERDELGFTHLDVVSFFVTHIETLI